MLVRSLYVVVVLLAAIVVALVLDTERTRRISTTVSDKDRQHKVMPREKSSETSTHKLLRMRMSF